MKDFFLGFYFVPNLKFILSSYLLYAFNFEIYFRGCWQFCSGNGQGWTSPSNIFSKDSKWKNLFECYLISTISSEHRSIKLKFLWKTSEHIHGWLIMFENIVRMFQRSYIKSFTFKIAVYSIKPFQRLLPYSLILYPRKITCTVCNMANHGFYLYFYIY